MPTAAECRAQAEKLRAAYPGADAETLAERAITTSKRWAAARGAGIGAVSNPLAMVPAAMVDVGLTLRAEAYLTGVVGALVDPAALDDEEGFRGDILAVMFPAAAAQAVREVAVQAGKATTRALIRKHISKDVLKAIIRFAAKYLGLKVTQKAILTKAVPLVGSAIGAGWNWIEVQAVGRRAKDYFRSE